MRRCLLRRDGRSNALPQKLQGNIVRVRTPVFLGSGVVSLLDIFVEEEFVTIRLLAKVGIDVSIEAVF